MTKKAKEVVKETAKETVKRLSTKELLKSDNELEKISGVLRVLGDCVHARGKEKKQSITNKVSKSTLSIRAGKVSEEDLETVKKSINKCWVNIKSCLIDSKEKLSEDSLKLYDFMLTFGRKSTGEDLPDEILF